jgi:hypothetical protein
LSAKAAWAERSSNFAGDYRALLAGAKIEYNNDDVIAARTHLEASVPLLDDRGKEAHSELLKKINSLEMKAIVMRFESLGGRMEGCEFGIFQRSYGAEPLGLLRWSDMSPETTILSDPHAEGADWTTQNTRYGMNMHTFQYDKFTQAARDRFFRSTCRRLQFLRRKLLEDLAEGDKIFVYKLTYWNMDENTLDRLYRAIRKYGPCTLLYVRQPDDNHPAGTVELAQLGLMIGYIERFSYGFGHNAPFIGRANEYWEVIVRRAHQMWVDRAANSGGRC